MMVKELLNGGQSGLVAKIVAGIIVFLVTQGVLGGIWLVRLGDEVINASAHINNLDTRMTQIDDRGTRALAVVEDRQRDVLRRLERLEEAKALPSPQSPR